MLLFVKLDSHTHILDVESTKSIGSVKRAIAKRLHQPFEVLQIVQPSAAGNPDRSIADCGLGNGSTVHLSFRLPGGGIGNFWQLVQGKVVELKDAQGNTVQPYQRLPLNLVNSEWWTQQGYKAITHFFFDLNVG